MAGLNEQDRRNFIQMFGTQDAAYTQAIQEAELAKMRKMFVGEEETGLAPNEPNTEKQMPVQENQPAEKPKAESSDSGEGQGMDENERSFMESVGAFFKELPKQAAGGVLDALNNTMQTAQDLGEAAGIPNYALQLFDKDGKFDLQFMTPEEVDEAGGMKADILPDVEEADTAAGGFTRAITQFATGFIPVSKGLQAAGMAGAVGRGLVGGAVADMVTMDPHQARLSTLLNEVPVLQEVIPDYMADNDPANESAWEGRIKNALEGVVVGGAAEGLIAGATKIMKAYKIASKAPKGVKTVTEAIDEEVQAGVAKGQALDEMHMEIADRPKGMDKAYFDDLDHTSEQMRKAFNMPAGEWGTKSGTAKLFKNPEGKMYLNHSRINTADDIHKVLQNAADEATASGKVSLEEMATASKTEYKNVTDLLGREVDRPFTASEAVAAREILTSSAESLGKLAKLASDPMASPETMFQFRKALEVHGSIQEVVFAGRRATARSLKSWDIRTGSSAARSKQIAELMMDKGADTKKFAQMISEVTEKGGNVSAAAGNALSKRFKDTYYQVWINGLLSSPATHVANVTSNMATTVMSIPERYITAGYDAMRGAGGESLIQANARAAGFFSGLKDGFSLMTGKAKNTAIEAATKLERDADAISAVAWGKQPDSTIGKGLDYLGRAVGMPSWALEKGDLFFKGMNYRMMLQEKAAGQALEEGLTGPAFKQRVAELIKNPTDAMTDVAGDFARYQTFTNQAGEFSRAIGSAVNKVPGGKFIMPFVRTPANILSYGFERTPLALGMSKVRSAIKAGGSQRAEALARMSAGSMLMGSMVPFVLDGKVTGAGPSDYREKAALEQTGWKPYSVKIGDTYVSYDRLEPISTLIGFSADIGSIMGQINEDEAGELVASGLAAFSRNLTNKTFLSGVTEFVDVVTSNSPDRWASFVSRQAATMIQPVYSSAFKKGNTYFDPVSRDYRADDENGYLKSVFMRAQENIPGLGKEAPALRDIWGDEIRYDHGVAPALEAVSPIKIHKEDKDPVNKMIADNNIPLSLPSRTVMGVKLTNKEYSEYAETAGKLAKKQIDKLYNQGSFENATGGPDGMAALMIKRVLTKSRDIARRKLINENPQIRGRIEDLKMEQRNNLIGG